MLKDLFFNIWYNEFGSGWLLLVIVLFLLCCAFSVFEFARLKAKNENFSKKHFICFSLIILIMYQIIPVSIDFIANMISSFDINKAIKIEKFAIKTSVIPWQKGGYYCNLATLHMLNKDYKNHYAMYDNAYHYLKSYKSPAWGIGFLSFYTNKEFDAAIEIAKNLKGRNVIHPFGFISQAYLMKGDIKNAELYIDKAIQQKETYSNLAIKAYIRKTDSNKSEAFQYYKKAIALCKNEKEKNIVEKIYINFIEYENDRIKATPLYQGLKQEIK